MAHKPFRFGWEVHQRENCHPRSHDQDHNVVNSHDAQVVILAPGKLENEWGN
eukprot:CAMPEP_0116902128 /NCGR_PEP_ID=MMETSP0467-20121206/9815_1 /TAXON_ID=283647 /ORGANISM="Mesodinium pulex, Strain SPMC105" /LENGTH=51 /DNA_ID=CAMNT_0004575875 /DNA_START=876 /DNA_END=1034 /DNA_ORIENTATION=+